MAANRGAPKGMSAMTTTTTTAAATPGASHAAADIAAKAQDFAHRIVEFADFDACCKFFKEKAVDFDKPNDTGWTILMRICACGENIPVLLARVSNAQPNPQVIQELVATPERRAKLHAIVDSPNINGDTPLMMACVAKNVDAVRVLLADLQANASYGNANGMTALMCAARLSVDTAQDLEEDMAASSAILKLLLARDIHVNASEIAGGNTALHFALLSHNVRGVQVLTESAVGLDVMVKNQTGLTAFSLGKFFRPNPEIVECLEKKFKDAELAALKHSRALEKELMQSDSSVTAAAGGEAEKKSKKTKGSSKSKRKIAGNRSTNHTEVNVVKLTAGADHKEIDNEEDEAPTVLPACGSKAIGSKVVSSPPTQSNESSTTPAASPGVHDDDIENQEWQEVATKKNRRKISIPEEKNASITKEKPHVQKKVLSTTKKVVASTKTPSATSVPVPKATNSSSASVTAPVNNHATAPAPVAKSSTTALLVSRDTLSRSQPATGNMQQHPAARTLEETEFAEQLHRAEAGRDLSAMSSPPLSSSPTSPSTSAVSYHKLNTIFHRTFPMADELDIPVESFVIASSSTDIELQPSDDGLSISQLEVLQEAHLKAYHYLNEKKMELTRVLEAQRLEAQFALQNEILRLN